ncbi:hypothetical protein [Fastidiosibacter lacustris]|uniref:hypothetical protein n=1 Tax=Fastidiosibacter lacustris TaxID=2056695 RepID=UPI000E3474A4|nr:hypothetical protein [Fastidiosibacter lacustris]
MQHTSYKKISSKSKIIINKTKKRKHFWRFVFTFLFILIVFFVLIYRLFYLETHDRAFLIEYGQNESNRMIDLDNTWALFMIEMARH